MNDLPYWVALNEFQKFGAARFKKLLNFFPDCQEVWQADLSLLLQAGLEQNLAEEFVGWRGGVEPDKEYEALAKEKVEVITIKDAVYPHLLKEIYDPPPVLYYKGVLPADDFNLAVVGTRKISAYGRQAAETIVAPLARAGLTIVSGMALGIDAAVHEITLREKGKTVAVLGCGLAQECLYPAVHRQLAARIAANGCLMSEYPLFTQPLQYHFPFRNRIISGLSLGTLVVEATEDSGSLITAKHALEQNRELFAVPGDIFKEGALGPNNLLKMGARVVTCADDVLEALNLKDLKTHLEVREIIPDTPTEAKILDFLKDEPMHIDELIAVTGLKTSLTASTLTLMEMKGMVRHIGGMQYVLAR
ncbi:MAG: DNA-processing protein DprA [bacterium]|nr:DNA-processing protein DprA [bacterium]